VLKIQRIKLCVLVVFAACGATFLLTNNFANPRAYAYSAGPPAGHTGAPGEFKCDECHVPVDSGTGSIQIVAPQTYVPGQTYQIGVNHSNADATRVRWGFQLTAIDDNGAKAGALESLDALTQVLNGQGPFPARQYVEHTSAGTFAGQTGGASWTFQWTAPPTDVGPVSFYAAGNHANGDGNTSGDNVYFTFATAVAGAASPDFGLSVTPSARTVQRGNATTYTITVTPSAGFTGQVVLSASGLPAGASASFAPAVVDFNDSSPKTSTLTVSTSGTAPSGAHTFNVEATSGSLSHSAQASINIVSAGDADLSVSHVVSPNPAQVGVNLLHTVTVKNNGPATATGVTLFVALPYEFGTVTPGRGRCSLLPAFNSLLYRCDIPNLAPGASDTIDFTVQPVSPGTFNVNTSVDASENDPVPSNSSVTTTIPVAPKSNGPSMTVSNLGVRTVVSGLNMPTSMAFIGARDFLVLEKASGKVIRVSNGQAQGAVLDLAVNNASERGLLGIALHPNFASNGYVYLYWTESSTGADTSAIDEVSVLGNRVDRFFWNGSTLLLDRTLIRLRAAQADADQPPRGNHNGGVLRFGPDGKLYVIIGDEGRRGLLQNNTSGGPVPDDQFGGPEPDDAHLTGVILRLNDDGSTPSDNPFFNATTSLTGEAAANVKKIFAYGIRNSFGMDFDPVSGSLWTQENGDDSFDEINRVEAGFNGGWIQLMGPSNRIAQFKEIETNRYNLNLQQLRWPPSRIAATPEEALARLYMLPGAHYTEPEFSWKYAVAPSPVGFAKGSGLGVQYAGDLFVGASRTTLLGGYLFRLNLSDDRKGIASTDTRLADRVADNNDKFDLVESESLVVGRDFGITTDIQTAPDGNLYVVSLSNGAVYEVFARPQLFVATLDGAHEVPPNNSPAKGVATLLLDKDETTARVSLRFRDLSTPQTVAHIHGPAPSGQSAPPIFDLPLGNFTDFQITLTPQQVSDLKAGLFYVNVHSTDFPAGEIRGQFGRVDVASVARFEVADRRVGEGAQTKTINVVRLGDTSTAATVSYSTADGTASERSDYTTARGTLRFAPGETTKSFDILITDDAFQEGDETINLIFTTLEDGNAFGVAANDQLTIVDNDAAPVAANPIDDSQFFVRQHYHDFLNREPDAAGFAFWTNEIESCGADAQCREVKRISVSAAFFLSIEFQETGFYVYRFYEASFDRQPRYLEFLPDTQEVGRGVVVGESNAEAQLAANKRSFAERWVERAAFRSIYDGLSNEQYVDRLLTNTGITVSVAVRNALVAGLNNGTETRASVLQKIVEDPAFGRAELRRAFVLMQYFGYLRRNPEDPPDENRFGYDFWLAKLNEFGGDFRAAEMVKAFITSSEYRQRFGQP
jgi:uncharacterized repeat protein (TIGR01451 family)